MQAGALRHRVEIRTASESRVDRGEAVLEWGSLDTVWAEISPLTGTERVEAATVNPEVTHQVRLRHRSDVTSKERLLFGTREFEIVHVIDVGERGRELRLLCKETL